MEAVVGMIFAAVMAGIVLAPIVGIYVGLKHGNQIQNNARKRQMKTALLRGQMDEELLAESVEELRREGLL